MKTVTVTLNGQEYQVEELRSRANREWRARLESHFSEVTDALKHAPNTDVTDAQALSNLVTAVSGKLLQSVDILAGLLHDYAPALPLDDAYDSEILAAFTEVLKLAYPFGEMLSQFKGALGSVGQ